MESKKTPVRIKPSDAYKQIMTVAELLNKSPSAQIMQRQTLHPEKTQKRQAVVS